MATDYSDSSLLQTSMESADLIMFLRPVTNSQGAVTGYAPYTIKCEDLATSVVTMGLLALGSTLPDAAPSGGGLYLDGNAFSYSATDGTTSDVPLSVAAATTTFLALQKSLATTNPGVDGELYSNDGDITRSYGADAS